MDLAALLAQHLHADHQPVGDEPDDSDQLARTARGLDRLVDDVVAEVPSCVAVALVLSLPAGLVTVGTLAPALRATVGSPPRVLASLAVTLVAAGPALLVLQAEQEGAFLLVADDLRARLDRAAPLVVDEHLELLVDATGAELAGRLAEVRLVEQAVGVLVERGRTPQDARRELSGMQEDLPAAARQLLAGLSVRSSAPLARGTRHSTEPPAGAS